MNPNNFRPEVQARKIAAARCPVRARFRAAMDGVRGVKLKRMKVWSHAAARAGWPHDFPDFETFWATALEPKLWERDRAFNQVWNRWHRKKHKAWVAAGMTKDQAWFDAYDVQNPEPKHPGSDDLIRAHYAS